MNRLKLYCLPIFVVLIGILSLSNSEAAPGDLIKVWKKADHLLANPSSIAVNSEGYLYVLSAYSYVQVFDSAGNLIREWGGYGTGDGQFKYPRGIATDNNGRIYVTDSGNYRVQVFDGDGNFITKWGSRGWGDGQFSFPCGIVVNSKGRVFVTDRDSHRIQAFDSDGNFVAKWGSIGKAEGQLLYPHFIAVDGSDLLYVTEGTGSRVQVFDSDGNFITKWGSPGTGDGQFQAYLTTGITVNDIAGIVYVIDGATVSSGMDPINGNRIQAFDKAGNFLFKWGGSGSDDGKFLEPGGMAIDSSGKIHVADTRNGRIQVFDQEGNFISKIMGLGFGFDQFNNPPSAIIRIDDEDNVYLSDTEQDRIQVFDHSGDFNAGWSTSSVPYSYPRGYRRVAVNDSRMVYVLDTYKMKVSVFEPNGNFLFEWGGYGKGDGQFLYPTDIAINNEGQVYVVDGGNYRVQVFDRNGNFITKWGGYAYPHQDGKFAWPLSIAINSRNQVYVSDSAGTQVFDAVGEFITTLPIGITQIIINNDDLVYAYTGNGALVFDSASNLIGELNLKIGDGSYSNFWDVDSIGNLYVTNYGLPNTGVGEIFVSSAQVLVFEGFSPTNRAPIANAGIDRTIQAGHGCVVSINLDGTSSTDPDGDQLSYTWSGPFGTITGESPVVTLPCGMHSITLTVDDGKGGTATDSVVISVEDTTPPVITSVTLTGVELMPNLYVSDVLFELRASDTGSGVASVDYILDGLQVSDPGSYASAIISTGGDHTINFSATDNSGNVSAAGSLSFSLFEANASGLGGLIDYLLAQGLIDFQMETSLKAQATNGSLDAFINHVEAQDGKKIDPEAAQALIEAAKYIIGR